MDEPILISIDKAAETLSIGRSKVYQLISERRLLTVNIGPRRLVRVESVRAMANGEAAR